MDMSKFRGSVLHDEENGIIYKEGQGRVSRPPGKNNACYYNHIIGNWSRGILHGKRIEY